MSAAADYGTDEGGAGDDGRATGSVAGHCADDTGEKSCKQVRPKVRSKEDQMIIILKGI